MEWHYCIPLYFSHDVITSVDVSVNKNTISCHKKTSSYPLSSHQRIDGLSPQAGSPPSPRRKGKGNGYRPVRHSVHWIAFHAIFPLNILIFLFIINPLHFNRPHIT